MGKNVNKNFILKNYVQFFRSQQLFDAWPSLWSFWVFQYSSLLVCWPVGADRNTEVMQVIPDLQNLPNLPPNSHTTFLILDSWRIFGIKIFVTILSFSSLWSITIVENKYRQNMHTDKIHQMLERIKDWKHWDTISNQLTKLKV